MKIFDNTFAQAQTMLSLRGQRMEVLSRNIANAVLFLCTDQSSYINGETLHVNGGMYMA